jgi:hypothetical protein
MTDTSSHANWAKEDELTALKEEVSRVAAEKDTAITTLEEEHKGKLADLRS